MARTAQGEPFELVRSLQSLQDQIARGNTRAHANSARAAGAHRPSSSTPSAPKDGRSPKNARAAVLFVLSGGNAARAAEADRQRQRSMLDEKLLKGVLAYGEGRQDEAVELLGGIEARIARCQSSPGHVAFVQGELVAKKEPAKALAHLDDARLLAPGTLIEEAALRRQVALSAARRSRAL